MCNQPQSPAEKKETDHVWRFKLQTEDKTFIYDDPLVEMVRAFLADLLTIGFLTSRGQRVAIDGFQLSDDPEKVYGIFPEEP
ncbi:MAG: hypothetical protein JSW39_09150 [Desulfobacterales bacterium]|nr:MAG: hypothetical protein JSW39_09150 [Desulfobacterales bacterium]